MDFKDYYATLGVTKTATDKEIKQAYRKLARKFHPDVNPGDKAAEARFKEINEANEVLGDPEKRSKYDELGANWRIYENVPPAGVKASPAAGSAVSRAGRGHLHDRQRRAYRTVRRKRWRSFSATAPASPTSSRRSSAAAARPPGDDEADAAAAAAPHGRRSRASGAALARRGLSRRPRRSR